MRPVQPTARGSRELLPLQTNILLEAYQVTCQLLLQLLYIAAGYYLLN